MPTFVPFALDTPQVNRCRVCQGRWRLFFSFKIDESFYYGVVFIELFTLPIGTLLKKIYSIFSQNSVYHGSILWTRLYQ